MTEHLNVRPLVELTEQELEQVTGGAAVNTFNLPPGKETGELRAGQ